MLDWLSVHPQPPRMGLDNIQMHKPGRHESLGNAYAATGLPTLKKKACLDAIKDKTAWDRKVDSDTEADAADRVYWRGDWVDVRDTVSKWGLGQILEVAEGRVLVHYDGWAVRWVTRLLPLCCSSSAIPCVLMPALPPPPLPPFLFVPDGVGVGVGVVFDRTSGWMCRARVWRRVASTPPQWIGRTGTELSDPKQHPPRRCPPAHHNRSSSSRLVPRLRRLPQCPHRARG
jgi:hypothetical protein